MKIGSGTKFTKSTVETSTDCDVRAEITKRIETAIQEEVNKCSKDYFRNIKVQAEIFAE